MRWPESLYLLPDIRADTHNKKCNCQPRHSLPGIMDIHKQNHDRPEYSIACSFHRLCGTTKPVTIDQHEYSGQTIAVSGERQPGHHYRERQQHIVAASQTEPAHRLSGNGERKEDIPHIPGIRLPRKIRLIIGVKSAGSQP